MEEQVLLPWADPLQRLGNEFRPAKTPAPVAARPSSTLWISLPDHPGVFRRSGMIHRGASSSALGANRDRAAQPLEKNCNTAVELPRIRLRTRWLRYCCFSPPSQSLADS
jgi:hypothetical protein